HTDFLSRREVKHNIFSRAGRSRKVVSIRRKTQDNHIGMSPQIQESVEAGKRVKGGLEAKEFVALKKNLAARDVEQRQIEVIVETGQVLCIGGKRRLPAAMKRRDVGNADLFFAVNVPGFHAQVRAEEDNLLCIRRELGGLRIRRVDAKKKLQRIAREN